jgi:hypothetical protein
MVSFQHYFLYPYANVSLLGIIIISIQPESKFTSYLK